MPTRVSSKASPPKLSLAVQYALPAEALPTRAQVRRWVRAAIDRPAEITVRFVDAAEGRDLNRDYRAKDYATNVLSFAYTSDPAHGDLVVCAPVIAREADEQGKPVLAHYAHMVVHGVLHLQGYDHETAAQARVMEARERQIVTRLGYSDPYGAEEGEAVS